MTEEILRRAELESALLELSDEAILIHELDGFIAGLVVCSELIMPTEWLPVIWAGPGDPVDPMEEPDFNAVGGIDRFLELVMEYYNHITLTLLKKPQDYAPLFPVERSDVIWEVWSAGFDIVLAMRPKAWNPSTVQDTEVAAAMRGLLRCASIARGDEKPSLDDPFYDMATRMIPRWVVVLNEHRLSSHAPGPGVQHRQMPHFATTKVGRNDPCLCGSGKKYRKCCGLN